MSFLRRQTQRTPIESLPDFAAAMSDERTDERAPLDDPTRIMIVKDLNLLACLEIAAAFTAKVPLAAIGRQAYFHFPRFQPRLTQPFTAHTCKPKCRSGAATSIARNQCRAPSASASLSRTSKPPRSLWASRPRPATWSRQRPPSPAEIGTSSIDHIPPTRPTSAVD
jgi:hypothetical protein